jgi:dihydroxyacetone kinase-like protein
MNHQKAMSLIDTDFLARFFQNAAARLDAHRDELCHLDGEIGDGDHGSSMANGFAAVAALVRGGRHLPDDPAALMREAAAAFLGDVGATVGPLYATAMLDAAGTLDAGPLPFDRAPEFLAAMAGGIARRGKAETGDKTMLDAWLPAVRAAELALRGGAGPAEAAWRAAASARAGAEATATMIASRGRAARLKERSLGHRDPGAVSAALILEAFAEAVGPPPAGIAN